MFRFILHVIIIFAMLVAANCIDAKINLQKHPIYAHITRVSPKIDGKYALKLSDIVFKYVKKYDLPVDIFVAILKQESGFSLKANNCTTGIIPIDDDYINGYTKQKVCTDFGIGQIFYKTAESLKLDIPLLLTDLDYSVAAAASVLNGFKRRYRKKDRFWWLRYNCGNRGDTNRDTCQTYRILVERYL